MFGFVRESTGSGVSDHKFVGSLGHVSEDETGLIYMRARYMDPALGRFISEDPAHNGTNWYVYCENNPITFVDRTGKFLSLAGVAGVGLLSGLVCAVAACFMQGDWSAGTFWRAFGVGALTGMAGLAGLVPGMLVGSLANAGLAIAAGGTEREVAAAAIFGMIGGGAAGAIGPMAGLFREYILYSVVVGLLASEAESYATLFD